MIVEENYAHKYLGCYEKKQSLGHSFSFEMNFVELNVKR